MCDQTEMTVREYLTSGFRCGQTEKPDVLYFASDLKESFEVIGPDHAAWIYARRDIFEDSYLFRVSKYWSLSCIEPNQGVKSWTLLGWSKPGADQVRFAANDPAYEKIGMVRAPVYGDDIQQLPMDLPGAVYSTTFMKACLNLRGYLEPSSSEFQEIKNNLAKWPWAEQERAEAISELEDVRLCLDKVLFILSDPLIRNEYCHPSGSPMTGWLKRDSKIGGAAFIDDERVAFGYPLDQPMSGLEAKWKEMGMPI